MIEVTIDMDKDKVTLTYNGAKQEITFLELWILLNEKS